MTFLRSAADPVGLLLLALLVLFTPVVLVGVFGLRRVAFGMMVVAAFTASMNNLRPTEFMTISDVALLCALPLAMWQRPGHQSNSRAIAAAAGVIAIGGLIGTFFTGDWMGSLADIARFVGASVVIALIFARWQPGKRAIRTLAWSVVLGTSVNALMGILYIRTYFGRAQGLSFQSNHLGIACLLGAGVALALALTSAKPGRYWAILCGLILSAGVVYSGSRAALVGLGFLVFVALIASRDRLLIRLAVVGTVGVAVALQAGFLQLPDESAITRLLDPRGNVVRADLERDVLRSQSIDRAKQYPVTGTGFERALEAHSLYIQVWASAGVIGLLGLGWLVLIGIRMLRWSYRNDRFVLGLAITYVAFMIAAIESNNMWDRFIWFHLVLAGAAADFAMTEATETASIDSPQDQRFHRFGHERYAGQAPGELGRAL